MVEYVERVEKYRIHIYLPVYLSFDSVFFCSG